MSTLIWRLCAAFWREKKSREQKRTGGKAGGIFCGRLLRAHQVEGTCVGWDCTGAADSALDIFQNILQTQMAEIFFSPPAPGSQQKPSSSNLGRYIWQICSTTHERQQAKPDFTALLLCIFIPTAHGAPIYFWEGIRTFTGTKTTQECLFSGSGESDWDRVRWNTVGTAILHWTSQTLSASLS